MIRHTIAVLSAALLAASAMAAPASAQTTLTFSEQSCTGNTVQRVLSPYESDGFRLALRAPYSFAAICSGGANYAGSAGLFIDVMNVGATLTRISGAPFAISSIALATYSQNTPTAQEVTFTGALVGGGTVTQTFTVPGTSGRPAFSAFTFDPSFTNLERLDFDVQASPFYQFDDIVLNASTVPEPQTYALLGAGLLAVAGVAARRQRATA